LRHIEISDFSSEGSYAKYCKDVIRDLVANAAIVSKRCKEKDEQHLERVHAHDQFEDQRSSDNPQSEDRDSARGKQPSGSPGRQGSGDSRSVVFGPPPRQLQRETYLIDREEDVVARQTAAQGDQGPAASTPYGPRGIR
jgi:hypothetical protein